MNPKKRECEKLHEVVQSRIFQTKKDDMNDTATVRIFPAKGSPTSVRTAEISNWTGKAVVGPRSQLEEILKREEATKPGVYFL